MTASGIVKRIYDFERTILMQSGLKIDLDDIINIDRL